MRKNIGKIVEGVEFGVNIHSKDYSFTYTMNRLIGKKGEIIDYNELYKSYQIKFGGGEKWWFNEEVINPQLNIEPNYEVY